MALLIGAAITTRADNILIRRGMSQALMEGPGQRKNTLSITNETIAKYTWILKDVSRYMTYALPDRYLVSCHVPCNGTLVQSRAECKTEKEDDRGLKFQADKCHET